MSDVLLFIVTFKRKFTNSQLEELVHHPHWLSLSDFQQHQVGKSVEKQSDPSTLASVSDTLCVMCAQLVKSCDESDEIATVSVRSRH